MPPRAERAPHTPPERRALQDALAWPIAITLLLGAGVVFFLPRVVPQAFLALAIGAVFAIATISLVATLAWVVERWLTRHAATLARDAERQVQTLGISGLPTATGDSALIPLASAFADAGARAALRSAERETNDLLAQLGGDAAAASERAASLVRATLDSETPDASTIADARDALRTVDAFAASLRQLTGPVPTPATPVDLVVCVHDVVSSLPPRADLARVTSAIDADRGMVLIDRARISDHLRELLEMARTASPADGIVTIHVSRIFRSNIEETPVRRTGDSRLTIVPRASADVLRNWVQRAQPGAEVLSIVVTDRGSAPTTDAQLRAFDAFAMPRTNDPFGIALPTIRRTVIAAKGTIWIDGSREGGSAVHLLLPIATT
ncbi:MAG: ATP-binding protein [Gemmatimonadaceae bacterium]|nr:ATP-binding protein [Gemmatimonadaceae bacterium]